MEVDIRSMGAVADGRTLNTKLLQQAIDTCHAAGGGRVVLSGGVFLTGSIRLKSHVELHIAPDSVLRGSPCCEDYPEWSELVHVNRAMLPRERSGCLILAEEAENIAITGRGTISCSGEAFVVPDGNGRAWAYKRIDAPTPPRVVFFAGCKNVKVADVTMTDQPAGWSYWVHDCEYVSFDRCKILANVQYPNNDGIHVNCSRNVTISNCMIACGDDCIIVRANAVSLAENKACEKVTVTNCNLTSHSGGIRVGWIKDGEIRNCTFSNIVMTDTAVGISILLPERNGSQRISDEGRQETLIENLSFDNIVMDRGYSMPVYIDIRNSPATACKAIRNIYFSNIHSRAYALPSLVGRDDVHLKNIYFNNCTFEQLDPRELDPDKHYGAKGPWTDEHYPTFKYADNVVLNNTVFTAMDW